MNFVFNNLRNFELSLSEPYHIPELVTQKSYMGKGTKVASREDLRSMKKEEIDDLKEKYYVAWRFHAKVTDTLSFLIGRTVFNL